MALFVLCNFLSDGVIERGRHLFPLLGVVHHKHAVGVHRNSPRPLELVVLLQQLNKVLKAVLAAAYLPALGGATIGLDRLCTAAVLQGLRLRRKATGVGTVARYDLDGTMVANTWSAMESRTYWDLETKELVLEGSSPFAGELMVVG